MASPDAGDPVEPDQEMIECKGRGLGWTEYLLQEKAEAPE